MNEIPQLQYPYGSLAWNRGCMTVTHQECGQLHVEYQTDYQSRVEYPTQHLSGEYALQLLFPDGSIGLHPQLSSFRTENEQLVITLADNRYPQLLIELQAELTKEGIYTQNVTIHNGLEVPVLLLRAASLTLVQQASAYHVTTFRGVWAGEHMMQEEDVQCGNMLTAASATGVKVAQEGIPAMLIALDESAREDHGACLLASLCHSGNYALNFTHNAHGKGFLAMGHDFATAPYHLAAGQSITLPQALVIHALRGKGDASRRLHRFLRRRVIPHGNRVGRTLLNSWEGIHFDIREDTICDIMQRTADLGIDMFVLDDGWFGKRQDDTTSLGDWEPDSTRLPRGLQPLIEQAQKLNISFGLWMEPEMISPDSGLYRKHPDWAIQLPRITPTRQRHQLILNLTRPEVEEYVQSAVARILQEYPGITYIKWDCNRMITDAPCCNLYFDYITAYYRIMKRLRTDFPHVTFQCCSAGGGRMDHGAAQYHEEFWLSDNTDAYDRLRMQWSASHLFPANSIGAHVTVSPNLYTGRATPLKFRFDVALAGRLGFELDPRQLSDEDAYEIRERIALYRKLAPLTQLGDVYRICSPYEGTDCALLYTDNTQALLLAYTTERCFTHQHTRFKLRGISENTHYHLAELMPDSTGKHCPVDDGIISGYELIHNGLPIRWNRPMQSVVILLTPQA